jgi:hypothetical protein
MLDVVQRIQRADASQRDKLLAVERGGAKRKTFDGCERSMDRARFEKRFDR